MKKREIVFIGITALMFAVFGFVVGLKTGYSRGEASKIENVQEMCDNYLKWK